jgi:hypothetical protein
MPADVSERGLDLRNFQSVAEGGHAFVGHALTDGFTDVIVVLGILLFEVNQTALHAARQARSGGTGGLVCAQRARGKIKMATKAKMRR